MGFGETGFGEMGFGEVGFDEMGGHHPTIPDLAGDNIIQ